MLIHNLGAVVSETLVLSVALRLGAPTKRTPEMGDVFLELYITGGQPGMGPIRLLLTRMLRWKHFED